jgi:hypothetical protein
MWQRFRVVSLFLLLVTTHQRAVAAAAAARQQGGTEGGGGHNQATTYTVEVPQYSAGDGRRVVELTFHPPALITGAINTSLYDAPDKNVSMLNASARRFPHSQPRPHSAHVGNTRCVACAYRLVAGRFALTQATN